MQKTWAEKTSEYARFVADHQRHPERAKAAPEAERRLGVWANRQRSQLRLGTVRPEREYWIRENLLPAPRPRAWRERARAFEDFVEAHERTPTASKRAPEKEVELAKWGQVQRARMRQGCFDERRAEWVVRNAPSTTSRALPSRRGWETTASEYLAFLNSNGRHPARSNGGKELRLAAWMVLQRQRYIRSRDDIRPLTPEQRAFLDERIPDWQPGVARFC